MKVYLTDSLDGRLSNLPMPAAITLRQVSIEQVRKTVDHGAHGLFDDQEMAASIMDVLNRRIISKPTLRARPMDWRYGSKMRLDRIKLCGHKTPSFVLWLVAHGVMPLYTPLSGSWLNMAESIQRIIVPRALAGTHMESSEQTINALEATVRGWNCCPTPFVWGGKRKQRRDRANARRHEYRLGGSGAVVQKSLFQCRMTH